jgi:hypothetical protein
VVGTALAVAMSQAPWIERSLYPYAVMTQTTPILACVPPFGLWFGYSFPSRTTVVVIFAIFPIIANTLFGLQSVQRRKEAPRPVHRYLRRLHLFQVAGRCQPAVPVSPKPNRLAPASRFTGDCPAEAGAHTPIHGRFSGLRATPGDHKQRHIA